MASGATYLEAGRRVAIRHIAPGDRDEYMELRRASRAHLERWEPAPESGFDPFADIYFERQLAQARTPTTEKLVLVQRDPVAIVGHMTIGGIIRGAGQMAHLGYWLGAAHEGKGMMGEGIALTLRYAFTSLGLHRIEANIMPINARSRAVLKRNGFRYEGLSKALVQIRGAYRDHERYAITKEEWSAGQMLE